MGSGSCCLGVGEVDAGLAPRVSMADGEDDTEPPEQGTAGGLHRATHLQGWGTGKCRMSRTVEEELNRAGSRGGV